jgi:hypothetical protein
MKNIYKSYLLYLRNHPNDLLNRYVIFHLPYELLRAENENGVLRNNGAFFSGDAITSFLLKDIVKTKRTIFDPTAGCGDLILRYLDGLNVNSSFEKTIEDWETIVFAAERECSFVKMIKLRLWLLAKLKHGKNLKISQCVLPNFDDRFRGVVHCDALKNHLFLNPSLILMNPPFQQVDSCGEYPWCSGKVSLAAIFLYEMLQRYPTACVAAILPDVLRAGSRYEKLRKLLKFDLQEQARIFGRFDSLTDVDVFTINFDPGRKKVIPQKKARRQRDLISDYFEVHVGAVVPYRDKNRGRECFYLTAKNVPPGSIIASVKERIKSCHAPVKGPFVVVRRTSSPSDKLRCVSAIVQSHSEFHLDNHMIYIKPNNSKCELKLCQQVHAFFSSAECTSIINNLIRCRHLTIQIIRNLKFKPQA